MTFSQICLGRLPEPNPDGIVELLIQIHDAVLTEVVRGGNAGSGTLRVPVAPLAFWLAEKWWRLRWEPKTLPASNGWRMSHEMSAIGHGHAWPRVTIWGDRDRIMLVSKADLPGIAGPVRFTNSAVTFVPAEDFETTLDDLFEQASSIMSPADREEFGGLLNVLTRERQDPDSARWRRLEAIAGFNPDEASEDLIGGLLELEDEFEEDDVEEAVAAAPGTNATQTLRDVIAAATGGLTVDLSEVVKLTGHSRMKSDSLHPWEAAERLAAMVRNDLGRGKKPLLNRGLAELAGLSRHHLKDLSRDVVAPFAVRLMRPKKESTVLLTQRWTHDRRFQLGRAIGDAIWTKESALGAISHVSSSRQKFQRAFAAALLCPVEGLREYLSTDHPTDSDITAAARYFHVNEKTVRTVLVNKRLIDRQRLGQPLSDALDADSVDEVADAA